jgi:hypothetical protein
VIFLCCSSFHFATIEEYYTGGLFLPVLNGISDGSFGLIGMYILMGIFSNNFWIEIEVFDGFLLRDALMGSVAIG